MVPEIFLAAALAMAQPSDGDIAHRFTGALEGDDFPAFLDQIAPGANDANQWRSVREAMERYDCIEVTSYRVERRENVLVITLDASAVVAGASHKPHRFPRVWRLTLDGARIELAEMAESTLAREIAAAKTLERRRELFRARTDDVDPELLIREIVEASMATLDQSVVSFAAECSREIGDRAVETYCLRILSGIRRWAADAQAIRTAADASLNVAMDSGEPDALADGLFVTGIADWIDGDSETALSKLLQSVALIDFLDDPRIALKSLQMASHIETRRGNHTAALLLAERNLVLSRKYGWLEGEMNARFVQSISHWALGNGRVGMPMQEEILRLAKRRRDRRAELMALSNLAEYSMQWGDYGTAVKFLHDAIAIGTMQADIQASVTTTLGVALTKLGRYREAEEALRESEALGKGDKQQATLTLVALSELRLAQGNAEEALRFSREAIAIAATDDSSGGALTFFGSWESKLAEGRALRTLARCAEAAAAFREAIALIEIRRASVAASAMTSYGYLDAKAPAYRELAEILVEMGKMREAIAVADAIKARALLDSMENGRSEAMSKMSADEQKEHRRLNERIARLNLEQVREASGQKREVLQRGLESARSDLEHFESTLYARHPVLRVHQAERSIDDPRLLLPDQNSAVIAYLVGEKKTLVFAISGGNGEPAVATIDLSRSELESQVSAYVAKLQNRDLTYATDSAKLYALLVAPIASAIAHANVVCIVPDGVLWRLPFPSLRSNGTFIVEKKAVFYAPSLAALHLASLRTRERSRRSILAFGNPAFDRGTSEAIRVINGEEVLADLGAAATEAREVAGMYSSSLVLSGAEATEAIVKKRAAEFDVLHFATHALVADSQPMYSSIVMSASDGGGHEDGLLEARELLGLDVRADLVVLSACSTARGDIRSGEGLIGLAWAFLIAGSPTTIGSQWKVASQSTAELMIEFHRALTSERRLGNAEALRSAQLRLMQKGAYRHPFYWSPFIVIGTGW